MGLRGRGEKSNPIISHLKDKGVRSQCVALSYIHRLERIQWISFETVSHQFDYETTNMDRHHTPYKFECQTNVYAHNHTWVTVKLLKAGYSSNSCPVFFSSRVVYRYSLLNQNDADRYDNEFETAISAGSGTVYHDSDDDEVRQLLS